MLKNLQQPRGNFRRCNAAVLRQEYRQRRLAGDPGFIVANPAFRPADLVGCAEAWGRIDGSCHAHWQTMNRQVTDRAARNNSPAREQQASTGGVAVQRSWLVDGRGNTAADNDGSAPATRQRAKRCSVRPRLVRATGPIGSASRQPAGAAPPGRRTRTQVISPGAGGGRVNKRQRGPTPSVTTSAGSARASSAATPYSSEATHPTPCCCRAASTERANPSQPASCSAIGSVRAGSGKARLAACT